MSQFMIRFNVYIEESRRPKDVGFQTKYEVHEIFRLDDDNYLPKLINDRYEFYIKQPGITVTKNHGRIDGANPLNNVANRMFVPWHMISHFDADFQMIPDPKSTPLDSLIPVEPESTEPEETVN